VRGRRCATCRGVSIHHLFKSMGSRGTLKTQAGARARREGAGVRLRGGACARPAARDVPRSVDPPFVQVHGITRNSENAGRRTGATRRGRRAPARQGPGRGRRCETYGRRCTRRTTRTPMRRGVSIHHLFMSMRSPETGRPACRRAGATSMGRPWPGPWFCGRRQRQSGGDRRRWTDPPFVQVHGITQNDCRERGTAAAATRPGPRFRSRARNPRSC